MNKYLLALAIFLSITLPTVAQSASITGKVYDSHSSEPLTGAVVVLTNLENQKVKNTVAGLDGTYFVTGLADSRYSIHVEFVGYQKFSENVQIKGNVVKNLHLNANTEILTEVLVTGNGTGTDAEARKTERDSRNIINIISAKQIQLSPDITVANVVQRVSGLSIERNGNGDPQYAVVRGMNKRYNNTLINGIKIPSPDNDNRFVPLDIFPAVFLEKLAVYKSLSADMEADAIGGTVDMVMKSAPLNNRIFDADLQLGYNEMNLNDNFATYDRSQLRRKSPSELFGENYEAIPGDFPTLQMIEKYRKPMPDILASASYGNRFLGKKLGALLGGSFQNSYRPASNYFYDPTANNMPGNPLILNELIDRKTSTQQQRIALHGKLDYDFDTNHRFSLYTGHYYLNEFRVRDQIRREVFVVDTDYPVYPSTRFTNSFQNINTYNLSGKHQLLPNFSVNWNGVYARAKNDRPDDGLFMRTANYDALNNQLKEETIYFQDSPNSRTWERNNDKDASAYLNTEYKPLQIKELTSVKIGGMFRNKTRDNYYNYYNYNAPIRTVGYRGIDWNTFADIQFDEMANPYGSGNKSNLVYDADEQIIAYYINTSWTFNKLELQAGLRSEHTEQGYEINPISAADNDTELRGQQNYHHLFPSASLKYPLNDKSLLKATYFKGISRPGFFEIVPTVREAGGGDSFYSERGNPDLKPTIGHSVDLRFERFPNTLDQLLVGIFYKQLIDPIEYGFPQLTSADERPKTNRILPQNFGTANNFGFELDYTKYIRKFGVRANYSYTRSRVSTNKIIINSDDDPNSATTSFSIVDQKRPLQGQSDHVGNISFLYKDIQKKWDAQLVLNYTGKRIALVSPFYEADQWMKPMTVLDFSLEKGFGKMELFVKANNLLDTPYEVIVDKPLAYPELPYPHQTVPESQANIRKDIYGRSYRIGVRYKL